MKRDPRPPFGEKNLAVPDRAILGVPKPGWLAVAAVRKIEVDPSKFTLWIKGVFDKE